MASLRLVPPTEEDFFFENGQYVAFCHGETVMNEDFDPAAWGLPVEPGTIREYLLRKYGPPV